MSYQEDDGIDPSKKRYVIEKADDEEKWVADLVHLEQDEDEDDDDDGEIIEVSEGVSGEGKTPVEALENLLAALKAHWGIA